MQTYGASIQLTDRTTPVLTNIMNAVNMTVSSVYQLQSTMSSDFDASSFNAINESMAQAQVLIDEINSDFNRTGREIDENKNKQKRFNDEISTGSAKALQLGNVVGRVGSMLGAYVSFSMFKDIAKDAISFASDLTEVQNVVDVTFGASSNVVDEWSTTTLNAYGLNELSAKQYAGTMGAMLKSSGLASESAREMSMTVTELAGDMASFYNLSGDEAFQKIRSGLSGETEPLKALGVNMSVANLEAYALSQGVTTAYKEMSQAEQVMLRYNYLLSATADAQGDFARTSDSYANQTKLLSENWKAFTGEIATGVLPYLSQVVQQINQFIARMQPYSGQISDAFGTAISMAEKLLSAVANVGDFFVQNWSVISPIIYGVATSIAVVKSAYVAHNIVQAIHIAQTFIESVSKYRAAKAALAHGKALTEAQIAQHAATVAHAKFNTVLWASPITWITVSIIALTAVIYALAKRYSDVTGASKTATGAICGGLNVAKTAFQNLFAYVGNGVVGVWHAISAITSNIGAAFTNAISTVKSLFYELLSTVYSVMTNVAKSLNILPGVNIDYSGIASSAEEYKAKLSEAQSSKIEYVSVSDAFNNGFNTFETFSFDDESWVDNAFAKGAAWGDGIVEKFNNMFKYDIPEPEELPYVIPDTTTLDIANTATATTDISDTISASSDEELEWLRKITEREAVNKFTTAEIKLDFSSTATLNSDMDIDGYINTFTTELQEALVTTAEGLET